MLKALMRSITSYVYKGHNVKAGEARELHYTSMKKTEVYLITKRERLGLKDGV